ncbi:hypothetical protein GGI07_001783 [Coemansia sp. Benny D115]|nr:hypothetical protein GGI07_001783 [Coemansia sp. Benny D115]
MFSSRSAASTSSKKRKYDPFASPKPHSGTARPTRKSPRTRSQTTQIIPSVVSQPAAKSKDKNTLHSYFPQTATKTAQSKPSPPSDPPSVEDTGRRPKRTRSNVSFSQLRVSSDRDSDTETVADIVLVSTEDESFGTDQCESDDSSSDRGAAVDDVPDESDVPDEVDAPDKVQVPESPPETAVDETFPRTTQPTKAKPNRNKYARMAHKVMNSIVIERNLDITRKIIVLGDGQRQSSGPTTRKERKTKHSASVISWPATSIHRYANHIGGLFYSCMGIDPLRPCRPRYEYVELEEPGTEWDTRQLSCFNSDADVADTGFVESERGARGDEDISDAARNGGLGLIIEHSKDDADGGAVRFLTAEQIENPELLAPRYSRVPLSSVRPPKYTASHGHATVPLNYEPLVEMTRAQVLPQILRLLNDPEQGRLLVSSFVSKTVAQEAVSGVVDTWTAFQDLWEETEKENMHPTAGASNSGWISLLNCALAAGMPEEVVARAYHRLKRLCDVPSKLTDTYFYHRRRIVSFTEKRKYHPSSIE